MKNKISDYTLLDQLGIGAYSIVYKALNAKNGEIYAIKKIKETTKDNTKIVKNEIDLLKKINHPNIIRYFTDFQENGKWYIVLEYCGKGDLQKYKNKQQQIPEVFCKNFAHKIVKALMALHQNNIVHRDLKLANILINDDYQIKLADFGFSKNNQQEFMESYCGTPMAMAPQILQHQSYTEKCDTWSLGVMIYQLIYGVMPFIPTNQFGKGIFGLTNCVLKSKPKFPESTPVTVECISFIQACLEKNMNKRPSMKDLMSHGWFKRDVSSRIGKQYLQNSMNQQSECKALAAQVLYGAFEEHLKKLLIKSLLYSSGVRKNYSLLCNLYAKNSEIKRCFLLMSIKKLSEITDLIIIVNIMGRIIQVPLAQIKNFKQHCENLKQFLKASMKQYSSLMQECKKKNIEKTLINFTLKQVEILLENNDINSEKGRMFIYLSNFAVYTIPKAQINIQWAFTDDLLRKDFNSYIEQMKIENIMNSINEKQFDKTENLKNNWLIQHHIDQQKRQGFQIEISTFINYSLQANLLK